MVGKNNHAQDLRDNLTTHYKAYKAGKHWCLRVLQALLWVQPF
ncbi:KxYKxGKxW signal peptide domain-containing protein [Secundilactobacillus paracollinoides]